MGSRIQGSNMPVFPMIIWDQILSDFKTETMPWQTNEGAVIRFENSPPHPNHVPSPSSQRVSKALSPWRT